MSLFSTHPPLTERIARLRGRSVADTPSGSGHAADRGRTFWDQLSK